VSWVTESWRLKLLAIGLSVLMLGAVAFAQNPPTFKTLTASITYAPIPDNLIVINGPTKTTVRVTGLADAIQTVNASSLTANFDLSKATPGPAVKINLTVKSADPTRISVANPSVPFVLDIEPRKTIALTVQVRYPRVAPGWVVTKADAACPNSPCIVNFEGPADWETKLSAYADFTAPVQNDKTVAPNIPVNLENNGIPLDVASFLRTTPNSSLSPSAVEVQITAKTSTTSKQVVLIDSPPTHGPPSGYRVTAISISPITVVISGRADILSKITTVALPAVDLSSNTSDVTFRIPITYPAGVTGPAQTARVTYSISANPSAQPTPSP
jgi:YbbR domain-containing protein